MECEEVGKLLICSFTNSMLSTKVLFPGSCLPRWSLFGIPPDYCIPLMTLSSRPWGSLGKPSCKYAPKLSCCKHSRPYLHYVVIHPYKHSASSLLLLTAPQIYAFWILKDSSPQKPSKSAVLCCSGTRLKHRSLHSHVPPDCQFPVKCCYSSSNLIATIILSAYMVFHAKGLVGNRVTVRCSADRSASPRL